MKQDIEFCAYIMDHSCPALLHLEPAEYYVEGEKPGPLKEPEQKADMLQLVQPVILNFEIRKSCTNLVLACLSGLWHLWVAKSMRVTLPKSIIVFKLWDKTRGRQWCVCSEAQHAIVKSDDLQNSGQLTCRTSRNPFRSFRQVTMEWSLQRSFQ